MSPLNFLLVTINVKVAEIREQVLLDTTSMGAVVPLMDPISTPIPIILIPPLMEAREAADLHHWAVNQRKVDLQVAAMLVTQGNVARQVVQHIKNLAPSIATLKWK